MTAPTLTQVATALDWLRQRGGPFYPSAQPHVDCILAHIEDLEQQIQNLLMARECRTQGDQFDGTNS